MSLENRNLGLIEDDPIMGELLAQRLKLEGAKVRWWKTGAEALRGLSEASADAVICDIRLPDRSGGEVFRSIARRPQVRRHSCSSLPTATSSRPCSLMREGARDYLTKPFVMSEFLARLEQVLGLDGAGERSGARRVGSHARARAASCGVRRASAPTCC